MPKCKKNYKDMDKYYAMRIRQKARYRARTGAFRYGSKPWTKDELAQVMEHSIPDRELSEKIKRSVSAIQLARYKVRNGVYSL